MFALPYLAGPEFVTMLEHFGYRVRTRRGGLATLWRDGNALVVPEASTLSPTLVRAMLRTANVDVQDFMTEIGEVVPPPSKQVA